jgi:WD40 repeat protein
MDDPRQSIFQVIGPNGQCAGMGFAVSEEVVITCRHVVERACAVVGETVRLRCEADLRSKQFGLIDATVKFLASNHDIAFLEFQPEFKNRFPPMQFAMAENLDGLPVCSHGRPGDSSQEVIEPNARLDARVWSKDGKALWQISSTKITPGFSGAPLWLKDKQYVVGMITSIMAPDEYLRMQEVCYAIPSEDLINLNESVQKYQSQFRNPSFIELTNRKKREDLQIERNAYFTGRVEECSTLTRKILDERCQVVVLQGVGGIGKTACVMAVVEKIRNEFEFVFGRKLVIDASADNFVERAIQYVSENRITKFEELNWPQKCEKLLSFLQEKRCLLIIDNFESLMDVGLTTKHNQEELAKFNDLITRIALGSHQSCLLITSREHIDQIRKMDGQNSIVFTKTIKGIDSESIHDILENKNNEFAWTPEICQKITNQFNGHPLFIMLIAPYLVLTPGGEIKIQGNDKTALFNLEDFKEIKQIMEWSFNRISKMEQDILLWMAIEREAVNASKIKEDFLHKPSSIEIQNALLRLYEKYSLIIKSGDSFIEQNVVLEFVTAKIVEKVFHELISGNYDWFNGFSLEQATAKEYIRISQIHQIIEPVLEILTKEVGEENLFPFLDQVLQVIKQQKKYSNGYAAGNLFNILTHLKSRLLEYDFSDLVIREAYLTGTRLIRFNFQNATFDRCKFANTFGWVISAAYHPSGQQIVVGDNSGVITCWDLDKDKLVWWKDGHHAQWVQNVFYSHDGTKIFSGGEDNDLRVWNPDDGALLEEYSFKKAISTLAISEDDHMLAAGFDDGKIKLVDLQQHKILNHKLKHKDRVYSVCFHPNGKNLLSGCADNSLYVWNLEDDSFINIGGELHSEGISCIKFNNSGTLFASSDFKDTFIIWDSERFTPIQVTRGSNRGNEKGHETMVYAVTFNCNDTLMASGSLDRTLKIWDTSTWECKKTLVGHRDGARTVQFHPHNPYLLLSAGSDQTVRQWNIETQEVINLVRGYKGNVVCIAMSPEQKYFASSSNDHSIRIWDVEKEKETIFLEEQAAYIPCVTYSPDGKLLASCCYDGTVVIWNTETGKVHRTFRNRSGIGLNWVQFSPNGKEILGSDDIGIISIWSVKDEMLLRELHYHKSVVYSFKFIPGKNLLASVGDDGRLFVYDFDRQKVVCKTPKDKDGLSSIGCSLDGKYLAIGGFGPNVEIWDSVTWKRLHTLPSNDVCTMGLAFSPDAKLLAGACGDKQVRIWDVATGKCEKVLSGHQDWVENVLFTQDGQYLYSVSDDETIRKWNVETGDYASILIPERIYEGSDFSDVKGLTNAQLRILQEKLGAIGNG